jgi:hypothetical protein
MSCALLRCERGATTVRYDLRAAALGLATLAVVGVLQLGLQAAVAKIRTHLAHQEATRYLYAAPDHVDLPTGEHVPLRRDGRTEHGFLPEDAWKEVCFVRARRAALEGNGGPRVPRGRKGCDRD